MVGDSINLIIPLMWTLKINGANYLFLVFANMRVPIGCIIAYLPSLEIVCRMLRGGLQGENQS